MSKKDQRILVTEYIKSMPDDIASVFEHIRKIILEEAPQAEERVKYQIPVFKLGKEDFIAFAMQKRHLSLYLTNPDFVGRMKEELWDFKTSGSTIHFSVDHQIPDALLRNLIRGRRDELLSGH